jgi:hypothetical protein
VFAMVGSLTWGIDYSLAFDAAKGEDISPLLHELIAEEMTFDDLDVVFLDKPNHLEAEVRFWEVAAGSPDQGDL